MLCIFPFEPDCYRGTSVRATYVGHPIADQIAMRVDQQAAKDRLGLGPGPVVAVLPGSRQGEIRHNGPAFFGAARQSTAYAQVVIPAASSMTADQMRRHPDFQQAQDAGVRLIVQDQTRIADGPISHLVMAAADVILVASGTATLEAALFKKPMVIGYRVPALTYRLMKRRALITDIGLPNILLGRRLVEEIIQDEMTESRLAASVRKLLDHPEQSRAMIEAFHELHEQLRCGAAERIAALVSEELDDGHHRG
jgi:lipid-A-disaccharide synthase